MSLTDSVVYQICPKSFRGSSGDGVGDLRGIIEKVDYIASLGVDHVWFNNHTSTEHKWFQRALAGDSVYQDYYYLLPQRRTARCPPTGSPSSPAPPQRSAGSRWAVSWKAKSTGEWRERVYSKSTPVESKVVEETTTTQSIPPRWMSRWSSSVARSTVIRRVALAPAPPGPPPDGRRPRTRRSAGSGGEPPRPGNSWCPR